MSSISIDGVPASARSAATHQALLVLSTLLSLLIPCGIAWQLRAHMSTGGSDFAGFYAAGEIVRSGNGARLYDRDTQLATEKKIPSHGWQNGFLAFAHAPFEALPYALFARLPYSKAVWVWWAIILALPYVVLRVILQQIPFVAARLDLALLAIGVFYPLTIAQCQGQDSIVTLLLCTLCFICVRQERFWEAGMILGVVMYKPPLAIAILLLVAISAKKRLAFLGGFFAACAVLLLVSMAIVGWQGIVSYPRFLASFAASSAEQYHVPEMPNLRGLLVSILGSHITSSVLVRVIEGISLLLLAGVGWMLLRARNRPRQIPLVFSIAVTVTVLVAYHEYGHDLALMFLPVLLIWNYAAERRARGEDFRMLAALVLVMLCAPILTVDFPQAYTCCILLFLLVLCRHLYRTSIAPRPEQGNATV